MKQHLCGRVARGHDPRGSRNPGRCVGRADSVLESTFSRRAGIAGTSEGLPMGLERLGLPYQGAPSLLALWSAIRIRDANPTTSRVGVP